MNPAQHGARTIAAGSKSFAAAARLFDRPTRESVVMLYAWCRHCDDVVDGQVLGHDAREGAANGAAARLARLEALTRDALRGAPSDDPVFAGLARTFRRHAIPDRYAFAHLDGFRMDVEGRRYRSFEETIDYCYHVAGVVGLMMAHVMGVRDPAVLDCACDLGLAFQLTNIARDLVPDAEAGRVYLPEAWLAEAGVPRDAIATREHRIAVATLAARLVDGAEPYYASARIGLGALPLRGAWAIATALGVYRQIGLEVRRLGPAAWDRRVSTSGSDKARHVLVGALVALSRRTRDRRQPETPFRRPA